jgi:DNA-binding XRE family transcriptional regulator
MFTIIVKPKLTATRLKNGMSIRSLAKKAGINPTTVFKVSAGKCNATPTTAKKICEALGEKFDELFEVKEG